jgi:hypothetical protein
LHISLTALHETFEGQLLDEGDKLGKCGVIYFGVLFLISEGVLLPSALDFAKELRNDKFNVGRLVEDSEASVITHTVI